MTSLNTRMTGAGAMLLLLVAVASGWLGYRLAAGEAWQASQEKSRQLENWQRKLARQQDEVAHLRDTVQQRIDTLTRRVGQLQGRMLRLDALGQQFIESGVVSGEEFNFEQPAAVGGPVELSPLGTSYSEPELSDMITRLERQLQSREKQLRLLGKLSSREDLNNQRYINGRPVTWGWVSSPYGYRSDPFTGKRAWHAGIDLAGRDGGDIISVAGGVVSFAGERHGYGKLVEINHGDGLVTRYAHAKSLKVTTGDVVDKGQLIALMGSSGRSTGPHVHFEVIRHGRTEDPEKYMQRASR